MLHFIPPPKLPSAKETTVIILHQVFRIHGLPSNIVLDRGPQFVAHFWKAFCKLMGATVSLSSAYHPQSNGQSECLNQESEKAPRCLMAQTPAQWSKNLMRVEFAKLCLLFPQVSHPFNVYMDCNHPCFPHWRERLGFLL